MFMRSTSLRRGGRNLGLHEDSAALWLLQMNGIPEIKGFSWAEVKSRLGMFEPASLWDLGSCAVTWLLSTSITKFLYWLFLFYCVFFLLFIKKPRELIILVNFKCIVLWH